MNIGRLTRLPVAALFSIAVAPHLVSAADRDWKMVETILGGPAKTLPAGVAKWGWPRTDLRVRIGDVTLEPALALGSWAGFLPLRGEDAATVMAMGDLVLLDPEVTPVVTALEANGLEVTAIHNHLLNESPHVAYVHFSGHGDATSLASGIRAALGTTKTPLSPTKGASPTPAEDATLKTLQGALGRTGSMAGRVLQIGVPRAETITENGMEVPASIGMSNSMNFQPVGARVATTGDFVLLATEVNPVIRELRSHGFDVTAIHSHMLAESPRLFFMHFWTVNTPEKVGEGLKAALSKIHTK